MRVSKLLLVVGFLACTSCATPKPPGPGERIGRSIDEIGSALEDLDKGTEDGGHTRERKDQNTTRYRSLREQWDAEDRDRTLPQDDEVSPRSDRSYDREVSGARDGRATDLGERLDLGQGLDRDDQQRWDREHGRY